MDGHAHEQVYGRRRPRGRRLIDRRWLALVVAVGWALSSVVSGFTFQVSRAAGAEKSGYGARLGNASMARHATWTSSAQLDGATGGHAWRFVAPMPTARVNLTAVLGPDGKIYAIGGNNQKGRPLSAVEAYDPATNTWTERAPVPGVGGRLAAVAAGPAGSAKIYAIGGVGPSGKPVNTVEAYDVTTNRWTRMASMPTARTALAGLQAQDGKIYALGGIGSNGRVLSAVEAYDLRTNTWSRRAPMPAARAGLAAVAANGGIYVVGGVNQAGTGVSAVDSYVLDVNRWTSLISMPTTRVGVAAVLWLDVPKIFVIGGANRAGKAQNTVQALTIFATFQTLRWSSAEPMNTARRGLAAVAGPPGPNQQLYAIGGIDRHGRLLKSVEAYGATTGWSTAAPLPTARSSPAAVTLNGKIYVIGGTASNAVEAYDPATNTWEARAPIPIGVSGPRAAAANGKIYVIGSRVEVYDPVANRWTIRGAPPSGVSIYAVVAGRTAGGATTIYVIGGRPYPTELEVYDPRTNSWMARAMKPREQLGGAVTAGPDGKLYVAGGATARENDVLSIEVYDPAKNAWVYRAQIPSSRYSAAATGGPDGRIYVLGGYDEGATLNDVEAYNPKTNQWRIEPAMPTARSQLAAVQGPDGRIYAIGGTGGNGTALNTVEVFTP